MTSPVMAHATDAAPDTTLRGPWLVAAWIAWVAIAALSLAVYIAIERSTFTETTQVSDRALFGWSLFLVVAYSATAAVILWRKHNDWMGLLVAIVFGKLFGAGAYYFCRHRHKSELPVS